MMLAPSSQIARAGAPSETIATVDGVDTLARPPVEREHTIHYRLCTAALATVLTIAALAVLATPPATDAAGCSTPRTTSSAFGPALRIEPGLCHLALKQGANVMRWERASDVPERVFGEISFGASQGDFSVWHYNAVSRVWSGWGPAAPLGVTQIKTVAPGELYFIDAPRPATWKLPATASVFEGAQVVSFYGFPGIPSMGILGTYSPSGAIVAIEKLAAQYDALNGDLEVMPALHPIVAVAQQSPNGDGTYLGRMNAATISSYVEAARAADALVFLDVQIGWADPLTEVKRLEPFLREPFVHLALDPEFSTALYGEAPGQVIGSLGAADVNAVQAYLAELVRDEGIPPKALVLHQFTPDMLLNPSQYDDVAEVEIVVDMDGFGGQQIKTRHYGYYALADYSEVPGIKLFFNWDTPLMSPETVLGLSTPPGLIIYQ